MAKPKKAHDPLANIRVEPPKTVTAETEEKPTDETAAKVKKDAASLGGAVSKSEAAATLKAAAAKAEELKAEKKAVVLPPKDKPKPVTKHLVMNTINVSWHRQILRLKGGESILSDEKFGPGAINKFRAMGVKLQEM